MLHRLYHLHPIIRRGASKYANSLMSWFESSTISKVFFPHAGKEKHVGGFDLMWNDGPVHSDEVGLHCGQPLVYSLNSHIGCRNNREEQLLNLFKDPAKFKHVYVKENKWTKLAS